MSQEQNTKPRPAWLPRRDFEQGRFEFVPLDADKLRCTVCRQEGIATYAPAAGQVIEFDAPFPQPEFVIPNDLFFCEFCTNLVEAGEWNSIVERRLEMYADGSPDLTPEHRRVFVAKEFELVAQSLRGRELTRVDGGALDCRFTYRAGFLPGTLPVNRSNDERESDCHKWLERHKEVRFEDLEALKEIFRRTYSYAIPNVQAISTIARYSPHGVIELCAGNGYWRYLLEAFGINVRALDPFPVTGAANPYWSAWPQEFRRVWAPVEWGDETALKEADNRRTLLLVWPPDRSSVGMDALRAYAGETVCYIGEWRAMTGNKEFHNALRLLWQLVETVRIPTFFGFFDQLMIFKRRPLTEVNSIIAQVQQQKHAAPYNH